LLAAVKMYANEVAGCAIWSQSEVVNMYYSVAMKDTNV